jgi:hypothetical protein
MVGELTDSTKWRQTVKVTVELLNQLENVLPRELLVSIVYGKFGALRSAST